MFRCVSIDISLQQLMINANMVFTYGYIKHSQNKMQQLQI